uniref:Uncharacterized protein n=1 Tax=viral metagenome TaxID=1070528 RepID=A0A6C0F5T8_9ZZZZ
MDKENKLWIVVIMDEIINDEFIGTARVSMNEEHIYLEYIHDDWGGFFSIPFTKQINDKDLPYIKINSFVRYEGYVGDNDRIRRTNQYVYIQIDKESEVMEQFKLESFWMNSYWKTKNIIEGKVISAMTSKLIEMMINENIIVSK